MNKKGKKKKMHFQVGIIYIYITEKKKKNVYLESVAYSKSLPLWEKTITATSASQSTEIS